MLYSVDMEAKTTEGDGRGLLPESVQMSVGAALRLNAWAPVAVVVAFVSRLWLREPTLEGWARVAVALLPLLPGLLYVRSLAGWMRGLDEFQRRLQGQAAFVALTGMLVAMVSLDLLQVAGFLRGFHFGWEGTFAFTFLFYAVALAWANRRYR